jgi:hypothetical protein
VSAHTPGPWEVDENSSRDGGFIVTGHINGDHIVICDRAEFGHRAEMSRANARLIAAAPRMAELLLSAWQHVSHGGPKRGDVEDVLREAGLIP